MQKTTFSVTGMRCPNCENAVCRAARTLPGVKTATADYQAGTLVLESSAAIDPDVLRAALEQAGYGLAGADLHACRTNSVYLFIILLGVYMIARHMGWTAVFQSFPVLQGDTAGYLALFVIGLLTSVHCIAMCGGINLGQSVAAGGSVLYNLGRLAGYTLVGGLLGALGSVIAITLQVRGIVGLAAGVFMILMGVNLAGEFSALRRLTPRLPAPLARALAALRQHGPFAIGLANALMPCGPLQSMQLYAIASGGALQGALSMFFFCLGTIPLVLGFGLAAQFLKARWRSWMLQASGVLLVLFGLFMLQNNLALASAALPGRSAGSGGLTATVEGDTQYLTTYLRFNGYDDVTFTAGIPVDWTIVAEPGTLNGCNGEIVLPVFGLQIPLKEGENHIKFTPETAGSYSYSCWMGMLRNTITVEE